MRRYLAGLLFLFLVPIGSVQAEDDLTGSAILALAREAAGGNNWARAKSLTLSGSAIFYGPAGHQPRSRADDYRMWRVFDHDRKAAHGPGGKVRIIAKNGEKLIFEVGYDGETTWTEKGIIPKKQADQFWANSFGFGIIRQAEKPGFTATRIADDSIAGHELYMVELADPTGGKTLFGIDKKTHAIRKIGFDTPRGWHERTYDDFVYLENPRWLQARHVSLYYDGRKSNEVFWTHADVDKPIKSQIFEPPLQNEPD